MPSYEDVMQALRNADAAGNVEDARKLADIASRLRATQDSIPAQPAPAPAPAAPPRREVGFAEAAGRTAGASAIPVAKMFGLAAATAARLFGQKAQDKVFEAMDRVTGSMEREYRPQAGEEFDTAGQFAGGILSLPAEVAGGFGLQHGVERAQEVVQRGGTVGEAGKAGAVTGGVRVALNALPVKVGGAVGRVVENAVGRVIGGGLTGAGLVGITGTAGRAAENAVLPEGEQFSDLRQNVAPSVAELGLGAAFGAVPGALAAARTLRGAAETPVRDLPRKVPEAEKLFPDGVATAIVKPNPVKLAEAAAVERAGGTVNVHNVTERPALREIGRAAQHVPFGGGKTEQNRRAITEATVKLLDPDAKDKQLSTEAFNRINDKNGSTIRENMSSVGDVRIDENVSSQLMDLSKRAVDIIDRDQRAYVMKRIADTLDAAEARGGKLPGSELAKWDSAIGEKIRDHHDSSDLTRPLRELQEIVRDAAEKHMPPGKAKETQVARRRYAYGMTLLPDIKKFGATGYIEPGQLWDLVNRDDLGKRRTMSGGSELTDLAKAAKMIEEPEGHGRLTVGTKLGIGTGAGAVAYLNPAAAGAAATAAVGGSRIYNRVGPALVRRLAKEYDKRQANLAAQKPEPPPLELAAPDAPTPQGPRPDVRGEAPAEVPEWTTTAGVDAQKPGSQIPAIEPEGLLPAVGDDMPPARINPEPRGRVPDIPAVPGRPDTPDVMVAGGPREVAATETTGRAMQAPEAALAREQQGYAPKKPEPPAGGGGGGGTPPTDPRLAKIAELRRQAPSQAVKKVLDAREAEIKKVIKRETDIAELEAAAQATDDVDLRQSLLAEANKLRGGKLPVGEVTEGMPDLPKPKTEKIPVGKVIEGQPDLPVGKTEKIPVGEATEITPEVVEPAPESIPVGEATEMPEPLPVGEVVEDPIPVGDAMEFEQMPVGEATEITPEVVEPKAAATESRKDKAEASFKRRYGEGYKAAAEERRALEEEIVNSFPTYQAGGEVVTPVIEAVERAWGRRRITMNPEGFERAVVEALRPVAERRKEWKTREKARDNDRRIKNQLAAYEKSVRDAQQDAMGELRTLERQGRLSQDEIEDFNRRIQKSETMDDAVDEMDALIMKKNQSSGTSVARRESAANEPAQVVPEATNVDNAPTAPAGGGRSKGMEQAKGGYAAEKEAWEKVKARSAAAADALKKYPKGPNGMTPDAVKKTEAWRRDYAEYEQAFANERKWNASMLRKYGAEIRAERQAAREAKVPPAPAPQAPAGGGAGTEPTKSIPEPYGSLGYKRLQYFSDGKPAEGYSRFDFGDPVVVRETGAKGTVDGILGMTPGGEPTHFVVQTDLGRVKVSTHAIDPAQENTRAPQAPAGGAQPKVAHAGMEIEEIPGKGGEPTRWQVTVPETGERVQTPSGLDAAKRMAENERKMIERHGTRPEREKAAEAARAAEEQARADTKKARSAETAGKSLAEIKAMDHMNRTIRVDGKDMKAHEFVDARLVAGDVPKVEMVDRVAPMSRRAFNRASSAEQRAHEAKVKAAGKKESYWLGGYGLSKTEYDYAVKKTAERPAKEPTRTSQAPAGGGAGMEQTKSAPAGYAAEKPTQDQAGSTAAGPGGSRAAPDARQGLEEKRQMVADMIATKKANREAVPDAWVKRMADLSAQLRGETAAEGATYSLEVAGHPMYDGPPVLRNLIPIKVKTAADAQKALDRALDLERKAAAEFYGAQQALKVAKTAAEKKAAQARVTKMNNQGWDADTLKTLRDETIAELSRLADAAPATPKAASKEPAPAGVVAEFQRQIDAVPRFGDGGPETITLKAGGSSAKIQNTARRVAEYMKELGKVKGGKTPKPVPKMTHSRPSGRVWWGTDLDRRAPLKSITDMIDDFDSQAAVDFAAAQGIDLEEALKGDRKRLDRVRGLKPTPDLSEGM